MGSAIYLVTSDGNTQSALAIDGKALSNALDELDAVAAELGLKPVSGFLSQSLEEIEAFLDDEGFDEEIGELKVEENFYEVADGIEVFSKLATFVRGRAGGESESALLADLEGLVKALQGVKDPSTQFRLGVDF